jgi:hypothetical protein
MLFSAMLLNHRLARICEIDQRVEPAWSFGMAIACNFSACH